MAVDSQASGGSWRTIESFTVFHVVHGTIGKWNIINSNKYIFLTIPTLIGGSWRLIIIEF